MNINFVKNILNGFSNLQITILYRMTHTPNTKSFGLTPKALAYILNSCCVSFIPNFNMANLLNFKKSFTRSYKQELWKDKKHS